MLKYIFLQILNNCDRDFRATLNVNLAKWSEITVFVWESKGK